MSDLSKPPGLTKKSKTAFLCFAFLNLMPLFIEFYQF